MGPLNCSLKTPDFTLCIPLRYPRPKDPRFYLQVTKKTANDTHFIQSLFDNYKVLPRQVTKLPEGTKLKTLSRVYDITSLVDPFIRENLGGGKNYVGPNCYATALSNSKVKQFKDRHVSTIEFMYYLRLRYKPDGHDCLNNAGGIVVYNPGYAMLFDAGEHAARIFLSGLVFQKGGYDTNFPYEIVKTDKAMEAMVSHIRRGRSDPKPRVHDNYTLQCYVRKKGVKPLKNPSYSDRKYFLPLFDYYIKRFEKIMKLTGSQVRAHRIDILTKENMEEIKSAFERRRVKNFKIKLIKGYYKKQTKVNSNLVKRLLSLDPLVVRNYLELHSLIDQFNAQIYKCDSHREGCMRKDYIEFMKKLYREHYVRFNKDFYDEAKFLLKVRLKTKTIPEELKRCVIGKLEGQIKKYNFEKLFIDGNFIGRKKIPYTKILNRSIKECRSR